MMLQEALDEFLFTKRLQGLRPKTISSYSDNITIFLRHVGPGHQVSDLTWKIVSGYILMLLNRKDITRGTCCSYIRDLKIFLRWISEEYTLPFNYAKIKVPKCPKKQVKIYSDQEIMQIFAFCQADEDWITARNRAIIAFCLDSGLRQCEIVNLKWHDIYSDLHMAKVTGKGAKDRMVPIGGTSLMLLQVYAEQCPYSSESDQVFLGRWGKPFTENAMRQFVSKMQRKLPFDLSSHKLRHNFATNFCVNQIRQNGRIDCFDLSVLMGHECIETTKRYEHFAHEILAAERSISHLDGITSFIKNQSV